MSKSSINLLQAELIPEKPLLTLKRVVALWAATIVIFVLAIVISQYQLSTAQEKYTSLTNANKSLTKKKSNLETQLSQFKPDEKLKEELDKLKLLMRNKQYFHQQLTDRSRTYVTGFSQAMTELSSLHHKDISLTQVNIDQDDMSFYGIARTPSAVPNWLSRFEQSELLSGKSFIHFQLSENSDSFTDFIVSTTPISNEPTQSLSLMKGLN